jgi:Ca-activated chloride channel homolog
MNIKHGLNLKSTWNLKGSLALILSLLLLGSMYLNLPTHAHNDSPEADLLLELPNKGGIHIENLSGNVSLEVWEQKSVSVKAVTGNSTRVEPPILIERAGDKLIIKVESGLANATSKIDLNLKLPAFAQAVVSTKDGGIKLTGQTIFFAGQTVSGNIDINIPAPLDADITAQTIPGNIKASTEFGTVPDVNKFQHRYGSGSKLVRLSSERGEIRLSSISSNQLAKDTNAKPTTEAEISNMEAAADDEIIRVETKLVTLNFSAIDRENGNRLSALKHTDFKLLEDNVQQQITHLESSKAPFDLVLLLDLSGSIGRGIKIVKEAALRFIASTRDQDRIAIITFAGETKIISPLTQNRESLRSSIMSLNVPKGDTKLYDALKISIDQFGTDNQSLRRKAIIVMSDGLDSSLPQVTGTGSTISYEEIGKQVKLFEGMLYVVYVNQEYEAFHPDDIQPETFDLAYNRMLELSEFGGGELYEVKKLEDLNEAYQNVVEDLGTVYTLSYQSTNKTRDGNWRNITVNLPNYPQVIVRGKRGYYAN